jgi:hypothetical protein
MATEVGCVRGHSPSLIIKGKKVNEPCGIGSAEVKIVEER